MALIIPVYIDNKTNYYIYYVCSTSSHIYRASSRHYRKLGNIILNNDHSVSDTIHHDFIPYRHRRAHSTRITNTVYVNAFRNHLKNNNKHAKAESRYYR